MNILIAASMLTCLGGCRYNDLPPKTSDAAKSYTKPSGEVPTAEERAVANAAKAEYEAATSTTSDASAVAGSSDHE